MSAMQSINPFKYVRLVEESCATGEELRATSTHCSDPKPTVEEKVKLLASFSLKFPEQVPLVEQSSATEEKLRATSTDCSDRKPTVEKKSDDSIRDQGMDDGLVGRCPRLPLNPDYMHWYNEGAFLALF